MSEKKKSVVDGELANLHKQEVRERACKYLFEATPFEQECLQERWSEKLGWTKLTLPIWLQDIGRIGKRSNQRAVCVMVDYALVSNMLVAFYHPTSRFVDYDMIEKYLKKRHPNAFISGDASQFFLNIGREL
jgi:hypothetical protein